MLVQVDLIRGRTLRALREITIYISCLPVREQTALEKLTGPEANRTFAKLADLILAELGHPLPVQSETTTESYRKAQHYAPDLEPRKKGKGNL